MILESCSDSSDVHSCLFAAVTSSKEEENIASLHIKEQHCLNLIKLTEFES